VSRLKRLLQRDAEGGRPGAFQRVKLRRRLGRQERMREALLLDLGAIIFELHRQRRREPELLQAKAAELDAVDAEVRALAHALDGGSGLPELTASGLVATCTSCESLMGSRDRFCPRCGAAAGTVLPTSENGAPAPAGDDAEQVLGPPLEELPDGDELNGDQPTPSVVEGVPGPPQGEASANGPGPRPQDDLLKLAQSKMRAGRQAARRWLTERRSGSR
jgi:hypothetical protein